MAANFGPTSDNSRDIVGWNSDSRMENERGGTRDGKIVSENRISRTIEWELLDAEVMAEAGLNKETFQVVHSEFGG